MEHGSVPPRSTFPGRPIRLIVESSDPNCFTVESSVLAGIDIKICTGPASESEVCPLVAGGTCPLGECDVVVSNLDGPWAQPVHDAWVRDGVLVTGASPESTSSPSERFDGYVGAALVALYRATYLSPEQASDGQNP